MATTTPNLGLTKPTVGADADLWGDYLNDSLDVLDLKTLDKTTGGSITGNLSITGTLSAGATTLASLAVSTTLAVTGTSTLAAVSSTNLSYTGTLTGGTGIINIGSGQIYKDVAGNVGIGTASPAYKLDVSNINYIRTTTAAFVDGGFINARTSASGGTFNTYDFMEGETLTSYLRNFGSIFGGGADNLLSLWNTQNGAINFGTNNLERLRIDSAGNAGLGVVPSAWGGFSAFDISTFGSIAAATNRLSLAANSYFDGTNFRYKLNDFSTRIDQINGQVQFLTAPSGTAGNPITFTQAMTLTNVGNLHVGTTNQEFASSVSPSMSVRHGGVLSFGFAGNSTFDTGISVNQLGNGAAALLIISINTSNGTNTGSSVHHINFFFDGNNTPTSTQISTLGDSTALTLGKSASNTLTLLVGNSGNVTATFFYTGG